MQLSHTGLIILFMVLPFNMTLAESNDQAENSEKRFFHQSFNNLQDEIQIAKEKDKKGLFIMFNDHDCPWCMKMKTTVMNQQPIQNYFRKHFQLITIDTRGDNIMTNFDGKELIEKDFSFKIHRVRATPVFIFFDLSGKPVMRYTGATRNAEEFLWLGEFVVNGKYKTKRFSKYKRERKNILRK